MNFECGFNKMCHGYVIEGIMYNINDIKSICHENIFTFYT
jgi:hypothetical protein